MGLAKPIVNSRSVVFADVGIARQSSSEFKSLSVLPLEREAGEPSLHSSANPLELTEAEMFHDSESTTLILRPT